MNRPINLTRYAAISLGLLALAGCDRIDPLKRPYMWYASGANAYNIAAMAANPADLIHGRSAPRRQAAMDGDAVDRVWSGKASALGGGSASGGGASGGGASGGGG